MKFVLILIASFISIQARAGLFIEPMVSYEMGANNIEYTPAGTTLKGVSTEKSTNSALNYGGRLGYITDTGIWLAGDYSAASSGKAKYDTHEDTYNRTAIGADLGMWNGRWNFWVGYNFTDKLEITPQGSSNKDIAKGFSAKAGIGYLLFQHVAFNIEYTYRSYTSGDETSADTEYSNFTTYIKNFTVQSYSAGLSFPF